VRDDLAGLGLRSSNAFKMDRKLRDLTGGDQRTDCD
jgi:hypothetical protein